LPFVNDAAMSGEELAAAAVAAPGNRPTITITRPILRMTMTGHGRSAALWTPSTACRYLGSEMNGSSIRACPLCADEIGV
jgi:hypothetical protein